MEWRENEGDGHYVRVHVHAVRHPFLWINERKRVVHRVETKTHKNSKITRVRRETGTKSIYEWKDVTIYIFLYISKFSV